MSTSLPQEQEKVEIPSPEDFCLNTPLYSEFPFNNEERNPFFGLEHFKGTLDCFCHFCGCHSVFKRLGETKYAEHYYLRNYVFSLWFTCSRDESHRIFFAFRAHEGVLQKIGQYPSIADLATPDLQKYRPILGNERFRELTRGVGLASHGVGIGAFVYLRRIFENLIEEARATATSNTNWDQTSYERARMDEKIEILNQYLPSFLVENRSLYGIISRGIHELPESECLKAFPIVKLGIELILDEKLEQHERDQKILQAKSSINALNSSIKNEKS